MQLERPGHDLPQLSGRERDPEAIARVGVHQRDAIGPAIVGQHELLERAAAQRVQRVTLVVEPERAVRVGRERAHLAERFGARHGDEGGAPGVELVDAAIGHRPQSAAVRVHRPQPRAGEADARDRRFRVGGREPHQVVDGAHPEITVHARFDAGHEPEIGDTDDPPGNETVEAFGGAGPEVPVAILHERQDAIARQAGQLDRALDGVIGAAPADAPEALPERAHPQVVLAVVKHGVAAAAPKRIVG